MLSLFNNHTRQGFTLIEMLVVMGIIAIVSLVVMANLPAFRERTSLDLVAEEVAITIRQAQGFGVATRAFGSEFPSHGVHFDSTNQQSFVLFADLPTSSGPTGNQAYDIGDGCGGAVTECREEFNLQGGVRLVGIEGRGAASGGGGGHGLPQASDTRFDIVFRRPESDAVFTPNDDYNRLEVTIASTRDPRELRKIVVWNTGHIYACNPTTQPDVCN